MLRRIVTIFLLSIILGGCTGYRLSSVTKGAIVDTTFPDTVTVTFCGNEYMNKKEVEKHALKLAAKEALSKGCSHFVVVNKEDKSKVCAQGSDMDKKQPYDSSAFKNQESLVSSDFVEPNITLTIHCVRENEEIPGDAIDVKEFLKENFPKS